LQHMSDQLYTLAAYTDCIVRYADCQANAKFARLAVLADHILPGIVNALLSEPKLTLTAHGDLLTASQCTAVTRYEFLQIQTGHCTRQAKVRFIHPANNITEEGFVHPITHTIASTSSPCKQQETIFIQFGGTVFEVINSRSLRQSRHCITRYHSTS
jgi:hypothetical protein